MAIRGAKSRTQTYVGLRGSRHRKTDTRHATLGRSLLPGGGGGCWLSLPGLCVPAMQVRTAPRTRGPLQGRWGPSGAPRAWAGGWWAMPFSLGQARLTARWAADVDPGGVLTPGGCRHASHPASAGSPAERCAFPAGFS